MAIQCVVGYQGTGKSFWLTFKGWKAMQKKNKVFSSYPLKGAYKVTFQDLIDFTFPPGSTIIIDECGRWFNSRNWSKLPQDVFDLFTLQRHLQLDLMVGVQNFNRIDVALREVIEYVWWARNYVFLPFIIYEMYHEVEHLGLKTEVKKRALIWKWSRCRSLYNTHAMASTVIKDFIPEELWDDQTIMEEQKKLDEEQKMLLEMEDDMLPKTSFFYKLFNKNKVNKRRKSN
jgi:hypothetical protein